MVSPRPRKRAAHWTLRDLPMLAEWPRACIRSSRAPAAQHCATRNGCSCRHDGRVRRRHHRYRALGSDRRPLPDKSQRALLCLPCWRRDRHCGCGGRARMLVDRVGRGVLDSGGARVRPGRVGSDVDGGRQPAAQFAVRDDRRQRSSRHDHAGGRALPVPAGSNRNPHQCESRQVCRPRLHRR